MAYLESSVRKCKKQFGRYWPIEGEDASESRLVFSNINRPEDDDWAFGRLGFEAARHGLDRAYFVGKDRKLRKVK